MPKILYLVTEDWFFVSHFLPMARAARAAGLDVTVATRVGEAGDRIIAQGFRLLPVPSRRGSLGIVEGVRNVWAIYRILRKERPDLVHCIALKPIVFGSLAAKFAGTRGLVLAPTGLGHLWTVDTVLTRILRALVRRVGAGMRGPRTRYLFENRDDPLEFGILPGSQDVVFVGGAGLAPENFPSVPEPSAPPVRLAVVSRMLKPKGIGDAVEATKVARKMGADVELHLFGDADPANPLSIDPSTLQQWSSEAGIRWHGHTADPAQVWREHHIALFLSRYREGLPRTIVEAAAAGRPIVTTDTPGCRDFVRDGREGFVVAPGDIEAAAAAIARLAADAGLRQAMGAAANARVYEGFTEADVADAVEKLYRSLLQAAR